jgi:hypothetical protein
MASFEFEASLRMQLREAAERERRRSLLARFAAAGRALVPSVCHSVLPVAAVTATVAAAISVAAIFLMSESAQRPVAPPEVVAEFKVANSLGDTFAAFGSVWMADTSRDELLRVEPDSRRVIRRLPVAGELAHGGGAGALWALQEGSARGGFGFHGPLLRIDPSTNRVTARIALSTPDGQPFEAYEVLAGRDEVWLAGAGGALRVDPRTNRVTQAISAPDQLVSTHFALLGGALWAITEDGRLLRFDTRTGKSHQRRPTRASRGDRPEQRPRRCAHCGGPRRARARRPIHGPRSVAHAPRPDRQVLVRRWPDFDPEQRSGARPPDRTRSRYWGHPHQGRARRLRWHRDCAGGRRAVAQHRRRKRGGPPPVATGAATACPGMRSAVSGDRRLCGPRGDRHRDGPQMGREIRCGS